MHSLNITCEKFLNDIQGRTFSDVVNDPEQPFESVLAFFNDDARQRRMEESEIHHDRPPLAGVVREFESVSVFNRSLAETTNPRSKRLRQAVGVIVRMIMQARGWQKTGRKGSLGVRNPKKGTRFNHNTGGLAFWFIRGERYVRKSGMPFRSVRERCMVMESAVAQPTHSEHLKHNQQNKDEQRKRSDEREKLQA